MDVFQFEECLKRELGLAQKEKAAFIKEFSESEYNAIEAGWKVRPIISLRLLGSGPAVSTITDTSYSFATLNHIRLQHC